MSFSVQPDEVIGIADRVRLALDETLDHSNALLDAVEALSDALTGLSPARTAFDEVARARVDLSRGIVSRGRTVLSALRSIVLTYIAADEDMAHSTRRSDTGAPLFDPSRFGAKRS